MIRPATQRDIAAIGEYIVRLSNDDRHTRYMGTVSVSYLTSTERLSRLYHETLDYRQHAAFIVALDGEVIGVVPNKLLISQYLKAEADLVPEELQPQPKVPPELLRFLGKTFCVWQHAVPLLESHTVIFPDETRCFDSLAEMYKLVGVLWCVFCFVCMCFS